jgi:uncharacterized protein (DUF58 family)
VRELLKSIDREAWVRFFIALGGLMLAFAAAMLSTVSRESGNVIATAVLASAALLLAGVVGVTTVPYLARRLIVKRVREAFDYEITREGVVYLILTLLIGVAALNTGNNLHFLVVAAMLAAIMVSGLASALILRGLKLDAGVPQHIFASRKVAARLSLFNDRQFLPAFSVSIVPPKVQKKNKKELKWTRATFSFPPESTGRRAWFRWPDLKVHFVQMAAAAPQIFRDPVYFPYIPPGVTTSAEVELEFAQRGRYVQSGFGVATRFPFSFLVKTRRVPLSKEIIVYPRVDETDELFEILPMITGEFESLVRGRGQDLYRIREYTQEDSARHVDWKASAKSGSMKVREYTREDERRLRIVFDNPAPGVIPEKAYEDGIALAASLAYHFAQEETDLTFAAPGYDGSKDIFDFLEYLALLQPAESGDTLGHLSNSGDYNIVFTARPRGSIPNLLWEAAYFIFMGK